MGPYAHILPEIVLLLTALLVLFSDVVFRGGERLGAWLGVAGALAAAVLVLVTGTGTVALFGEQFAIDPAAAVVRLATLLLTAVFLTWLAGSGLKHGSVRTFSALVLFSALGGLLIAGARDWIVLLLSLEVATMPAYVLMGFDRRSDTSLEGALKYFLLSMVASVLLMYGMSFIIGMSGSTLFSASRLEPGAVGLIVAAFVLTGLLAKLSAAPFQWWAPDAYAGAPAASVAFVSSVPKIAGLLALVRVAGLLMPQQAGVAFLLIAAAVASMLIGNFAAYPQQDIRRLMAYSGIAHAGYLLVGLASGSPAGARAAVFYSIAYAVPSMGVMLIAAGEGQRLDNLKGLAARRPWAAWAMVLMLVSLVGVPPLAGFTGKLYLFAAAQGSGLWPLVAFALLMSVVSAGFYFRIIRVMFFAEPVSGVPAKRMSPAAVFAVATCAVAVVALGVASQPVLAAIGLLP
jgi:NADH-quinone oxidoreductase subunit N